MLTPWLPSVRRMGCADIRHERGLLTCGNEGARKVGMRRAAGPHKEVLNLEGIHSQAGAEVAVPHRQVRAALGRADHDQRALAVHIHNLLGVCEVVGHGSRRRSILSLIAAAPLHSFILQSQACTVRRLES